MNDKPKGGPVLEAELPFHETAAMFPLMEGEEFNELVADIKRRGLHVPITTVDDRNGGLIIIDGRNRYRACLKAGVEPHYKPFQGNAEEIVRFVVSANIHRRHLPARQKRDLLVKLLKLHPEKSDRQLGKMAKVDNKTVAAARGEMERREEIPHVPKREDSKGRKQAARKPHIPPTPKPVLEPPPGGGVPDAVAPDEELALLREFAVFVLSTANSVSVDSKDHDQWKTLLGRVKAIMMGASQ
jgi:hypothetical protein